MGKSIHRALYLILPAGLLSIVATPSGADFLSPTKIALHVKAAPAKSNTICTTYRPEIPCSQYTTTGDVPGHYYVYLATGHTGSVGILGLSCGIEYDPAPYQGVDVLQWTFCGDGNAYPSAGLNGVWPASGGGIRMTESTCQNTDIPPDGVHAVWGAFYVYAYDQGDLRVTPNYNVGFEPELRMTRCNGTSLDLFPFGSTGQASFSPGATAPGENPCLGIPMPCGLSTAFLDFGEVYQGQSADRTITLTNLTLDDPDLYPHDISGTLTTSYPDFQVLEDPSYTLAPGESTTFTVRFTPSEAGTTRCRLDAGGSCSVMDLAGIGTANPVEAADFAIAPQSLSAASGGRWMTAYLELPPGFDPGDVDLESVRLQGSIPADPGFFSDPVGDFNHNQIPDLFFKFDRADLIESLPAVGDVVEATVTGMLAGPVPFMGSAPVRIVRPRLMSPNGGESFPTGLLLNVVWEVPAGWEDTQVSLAYTADGGASWMPIAEDAAGGHAVWRLPTEPLEAVSVRVEVGDDFGLLGRDESDGPFAVSEATGIDETPARTQLLLNTPNPFSASTRIRYDLATEVQVRMTIFNVQGQRVRVLVDGTWPAGSHEARWDGRDDAGKPAASGMYLVHFRAGTCQETRRMLLTR